MIWQKEPWAVSVKKAMDKTWAGTHLDKGKECASVPDTLSFISDRYEDNDPFFFVRNGDGEHKIIKGDRRLIARAAKQNAKRDLSIEDPIEYFTEEMHHDLNEMIKIDDDNFVIASWVGSLDSRKDKSIPAWNFYVFYSGMIHPEVFIPFLRKTFKPKNNLFIGPDYACSNQLLKNMFNVSGTYTMPSVSSHRFLYANYDDVSNHVKDYDSVICASGTATKVLAKYLYDDGFNIKFLDIGSCADAISGLTSRRWITQMHRDNAPIKYGELMSVYEAEFL